VAVSHLSACSNSAAQLSKRKPDLKPVATNETVTAYRNETINIDVLANDIDPEGEPISLDAVGTATIGTASLNEQQVEYMPGNNISGHDSFAYTLIDEKGNHGEGKVNVTISPWHAPVKLGDGKGLQLSVSDSGQAAALWVEGATISTNQFLLGNGWQPKIILQTAEGLGSISGQQVAINAFGQAIAVWKRTESSGGVTQIKFGNGLLSDALWQTHTEIWTQASADLPTTIDLTLNDNGSAAMVWDQVTTDANTNAIWERDFSGSAWDAASAQLTAFAGAKQPKLANNGASSIAVWIQDDPSTVWWTYRFNGVWSDVPVQLNTGTNRASDVQLAMGPNNKGIIVWQEDTGSSVRLFGVLFDLRETAEPSMNAPIAIDDGEGSVSNVHVDSGFLGNFAVTWQQNSGDNSAVYVYLINAPNFTRMKASADEPKAMAPVVSLTHDGGMLVMWQSTAADSPLSQIAYRQFNDEWQSPEILATDLDMDSSSMKLGTDSAGNAVAAWRLSDGSLWSSDYCVNPDVCEPAVAEHKVIGEACINCHDGVSHTGKIDGHIPALDTCQSCHKTSAWKPAAINHAATNEQNCEICHDGTTAPTKPGNHLETSMTCATCHQATSWYNLIYKHNSITMPNLDDHLTVICQGCHTTGNFIDLTWEPSYAPSCGACHFPQYNPNMHGNALITSQLDCDSSGCHRPPFHRW